VAFSMEQLHFSHHGKVPLLTIDILIKLFKGSDQWPATYGLLFDCTHKTKKEDPTFWLNKFYQNLTKIWNFYTPILSLEKQWWRTVDIKYWLEFLNLFFGSTKENILQLIFSTAKENISSLVLLSVADFITDNMRHDN
jgi:hypothetical protein